MLERFPSVSEDITFELLLLHAVAERGRTLKGARASALRSSSLWGPPIAQHRPTGVQKGILHAASALMIASTLSLTPPASLPAWAQRQEIRVTLVDAQTSKPLADVVLRDAKGNAIARSGADGKMAFTPPNGEQHFTLERAGYQSVSVTRTQLGGSNLVSMRKLGAPTAATPQPATPPTTKPVSVPSPKAVQPPKPAATPKPAESPQPVATPKPAAKPVKPVAAPQSKATPKPAKKPAAKTAVEPSRKPAARAVGGVASATAAYRYVVKPGDSLWSIAGQKLGNPTLWQALYAANRTVIARPRMIYPGQVLLIPAVTTPAGRQRGTHVVKRGESLWEIAEAVYGNPLRWKDLYQANRGIIKRPSLIHPGQTLTLPR